MKTNYSKAHIDGLYAELGGEPITKLKVINSAVFIFKPEGIYKKTKNGIRKIRKPSKNLLLEWESTE